MYIVTEYYKGPTLKDLIEKAKGVSNTLVLNEE